MTGLPSAVAATGDRSFGALLREWRQARGTSQLALSARARVSTRHLSYLETGRAQPSREMVLMLARTFEMSLRDCNAFLHAAGFAPMYRASTARRASASTPHFYVAVTCPLDELERREQSRGNRPPGLARCMHGADRAPLLHGRWRQ